MSFDTLLKPTRPRRMMNSPHDEHFVDHERVLQLDGRTAVFQNVFGENDWKFSHYIDKQGFTLLEENDQSGDYAKKLVSSEIDTSSVNVKIEKPLIEENELLHAYRYGGSLSMRSGWYITPKNDNNRVLRTKLTAMS